MTVRNVGAYTERGTNMPDYISANTSRDEETVTISVRQKTGDENTIIAEIVMTREAYGDFLMQGLGTLYGQR